MDTRTQESLARDEVGTLISSSRVAGTDVYNAAGEKLGHVEDIMIDKVSGRTCYAVMSFGGFLGMGEKHWPLPWSELKYDKRKEGFVVNLDKRKLEGAPIYAGRDPYEWDDRGWRGRVDKYYQPYL